MRALTLAAVAVIGAGVTITTGQPLYLVVTLGAGLAALQALLLAPRDPDRRRARAERWRARSISWRARSRRWRGGAARTARTTLRTSRRALVWALRTIGAVVSTLIFGIVFYLVITPLGLGARLVGIRLLPSRGWHRHRSTTTRDARRAFLRSAGGSATSSSADGRRPLRTAIALIVVGALGATLLPRLLDRTPSDAHVPEQLRGGFFNAFGSPALADAEWKDAAGVEFAELSNGQTYTSYVGNSLRDYSGRYVNVHARERLTYEPDTVDDVDPIEVWFFGGSTMFGFSAQRDLHTIPSEVTRLAEEDGIILRARNFGSPGYVNLQETMLAALLLAGGRRPDLIVFYDGTNDSAVPFQQAFGGIGTPGDQSDIFAYSYRRFLAGQLTGTDEPPAPVTPVPDLGSPPDANAVIDALLATYGQGIELARALGDEYDVPVMHFWQPDLFNKDDLAPGEEVVVDRLGMDQFQYDAIARLSRSVVARLPDGVIDITDAFDGTEEAILTDQAHTNELGAHLVAEAMYDHLRDPLAGLAAESP